MGQTQKQRLHSTNNLKIITDVTLKNRAKNHPVSRKGKQRVGKMNKNQITMAITNLNNTRSAKSPDFEVK